MNKTRLRLATRCGLSIRSEEISKSERAIKFRDVVPRARVKQASVRITSRIAFRIKFLTENFIFIREYNNNRGTMYARPISCATFAR